MKNNGDVKKLLDAEKRDKKLYKELAAQGEFKKPEYNPEMRKCHEENSDILEKFLEQYGWPFPQTFGIKAHEAAWFIAIHAISRPHFIKKVAELLKQAWQSKQLPGKYYANFYDRIELYEDHKQRYGTHLFPTKTGWQALNLENPEKVNTIREEMGMQSLEDWIKESEEFESGYSDHDEQAYQEQFDQWCKEIGWL